MNCIVTLYPMLINVHPSLLYTAPGSLMHILQNTSTIHNLLVNVTEYCMMQVHNKSRNRFCLHHLGPGFGQSRCLHPNKPNQNKTSSSECSSSQICKLVKKISLHDTLLAVLQPGLSSRE